MLQTKRLILRHWNEDDAPDLYRYAKDPEVGPIAGWNAHGSVEESRDIIRRVLTGKECYAVCLKSDNRAIGAIELKACSASLQPLQEADERELGFWIGKPFWGQGLIPEAAGEILRHAFEDLGLQKVWCGYYDGNEKSKRAQKKIGFTYRFTRKNAQVPLLHEMRTEHFNCLTKKEWEEHERQSNA